MPAVRPLKIGDPVTYVCDFPGYASCLAVVTETYSESIVYKNRLGDELSSWLKDEGVCWIRGHHDLDSPETRALLTAAVLVRT